MGRPGQMPAAAEYIGEPRRERVHLDLRVYSAETITVEEDVTPQRAAACRAPDRICWLDLDGIHRAGTVAEVGELFGIHPLSIEDILDSEGRAKVEYYPDYIYIIVRMVARDSLEADDLETEQISVVLGRDFVLTFQERDGDVFDRVRGRLREPTSRVRQGRPDYLAYSLLDAIVDDYFVVLDKIGARLEVLDAVKPADMTPDTPEQVHHLKRQLLTLRKAIRPLRDAVGALERSQGQGDWIQPATTPFLRDLLDNLTHEVDDIDLYRETCAGLLDLYQATADHRMNEEMRVLTVIATIFIPLTFITGLYGMNFDNMPELHSRYGYPAAVTAMILTAGSLIIYFRRKRWL